HFTGTDKGFWYSFPKNDDLGSPYYHGKGTAETLANVPTLGEARGKIVILNTWDWDVTDEDGTLPIGYYGLPFPMPINKAGPSHYLYGENHYSFDTNLFDNPLESVINPKEPFITTALERAQALPVDPTWYFTFTSATGSTATVSTIDIAEGGLLPDRGITHFLANQTFSGRVGTVVMDWVHPLGDLTNPDEG